MAGSQAPRLGPASASSQVAPNTCTTACYRTDAKATSIPSSLRRAHSDYPCWPTRDSECAAKVAPRKGHVGTGLCRIDHANSAVWLRMQQQMTNVGAGWCFPPNLRWWKNSSGISWRTTGRRRLDPASIVPGPSRGLCVSHRQWAGSQGAGCVEEEAILDHNFQSPGERGSSRLGPDHPHQEKTVRSGYVRKTFTWIDRPPRRKPSPPKSARKHHEPLSKAVNNVRVMGNVVR